MALFKQTRLYKILENFLNHILLLVMKCKLKRYKRDAEWYHRQGAEPNWYDEQGIPDLEKEISELENAIKKKVIFNERR